MENFLDKWKRLLDAAEAKNDSALARALGIKPPSVSRAKDRMMIPAAWVEKICLTYNVSADWILFGFGNKHLEKETAAMHSVNQVDPDYSMLKARIEELERKLIAAQEETIRAYKLATASMQPDSNIPQKPSPVKVEHAPVKQIYSESRADEKL